jgi:hypothetical protein
MPTFQGRYRVKGGETMSGEFWRTVHEAIQSNGKTARFCVIALVVAILIAALAHA